MKSIFDPEKHHRRSIRLKGYDYASGGAYFVTIVTQGRACVFGEIFNEEMHLNEYGVIVQKWWNEIRIHFPNVETDVFVIMPNHVHGIITINDESRGEVLSPHNEQNQNYPRSSTLGQIIAYFKYQSSKEVNFIDDTGTIVKLWQRNYYEHIIRNQNELQQKTNYILSNPSRWKDDQENPIQNRQV